MNRILFLLLSTLLCVNLFGQQSLPKVSDVLGNIAIDYNLSATDISDLEITHQHVSSTSGIHHILSDRNIKGFRYMVLQVLFILMRMKT